MYKIILHSESMLGRGDASNACNMYDMIQKNLFSDALITIPNNDLYIDKSVINELIKNKYKIKLYDNQVEFQQIADNFKTTHSYFMKSGLYDGRYILDCPKFVHAVFRDYQPHGDVYAFASKWLYDNINKNPNFLKWYRHYPKFLKIKIDSKTPHFPNKSKITTWMGHPVKIQTPCVTNDFLIKYNIKKSKKIITRIGGYGDFNDEAGINAVKRIVKKDSNIHFIFSRTKKFIDHPQVTYLNEYISDEEKSQLIQSSDLLLNCRLRGESFGFSICEALMNGKPIIAPSFKRNINMDAHHVDLLDEFQLLYNDENDLIDKIYINLESPPCANKLIKSVSMFSFEKIAERFNEIYLSRF
jgi:hypothetical protein